IGLYVERAIDLDDHETADRARCLNVINQEVVRLGRVVEEVLSVSEIEAGSFSVRRDDVKLDELVRRIEGEYREQAQEKQLRIAFDLPPKLPTIQGDREKIAVALHNLVGNAIKYTPAGGEVRVELTETLTDLEFRVTDTGIGIDESELSKVFEKFYRADDQRLRDIGGSGLGLALAREVIRLHGGDITAESVLNQGSTFTLRLPLAGVPAQGS
ncbi:MAG: HAMP domain-containing sensor histidine kinase, partial [Planctomycetota bacterium]